MDTTTLPPPAFTPFTSVDGYDTDVVVVGLGPAGGTAALALATYGVRVHAVTMFPWGANSPRAHITNQRAVEVLRDLGVEEEARKYATPWEQMGDTLFTTSLAGEEIVRLQTWGTGDQRLGDYLQGSPCAMLDIPQPLMEPLLIKNAAERGAILSFHTEYLSHTQDAEGVTVQFRDVRTGQLFEQRARYLLAFDGARSRVAEQIGLPFEGELARAGTAYIMFNADLSRYVGHRPSILHWIFNSQAGFGEIGMGLLRAVKPWTEWIAGWGFDMAAGRAGPVRRRRAREDPHPGRRPRPRGRGDAQVPLVRQPAARHQLPGRAGPVRRRRRAPAPAVERPGLQHLGAGRLQPGLEGRVRGQGPRRRGPARLLHPGTGAGGQADRRAGQPVPEGLRRAAGVVRRRQRRPGPRRPGHAQGGQPGRRRAAGAALRGAGAEEHRVQRARGGAQPALRVRCRGPRSRRRPGGVAAAPRALPAGHHPARGQAPARLARRPGRHPGLDPGRHRQGQVDPAHRPGRAGVEARRPEAGPAVPAHRRGGGAGHHRSLRLLARAYGRSRRRARSWSAPTATSPGGAAPPSGTTPRRCASSRTRSPRSSPSRSTSRPARTWTRPSTAPSPSRSPFRRPSRPPPPEDTDDHPPLHQRLDRPGPGRVLPGLPAGRAVPHALPARR